MAITTCVNGRTNSEKKADAGLKAIKWFCLSGLNAVAALLEIVDGNVYFIKAKKAKKENNKEKYIQCKVGSYLNNGLAIMNGVATGYCIEKGFAYIHEYEKFANDAEEE